MDDDIIKASTDTAASRSLSALAGQLNTWLAAREFKHATWRCTSVEAVSDSGASSEMFVTTLTSSRSLLRCVLRIEPSFDVYPDAQFGRQFEIAALVSEKSAARMPRFYAFEADARWLGRRFLLMERLEGESAGDYPSYVREGWIKDLRPIERRRVWVNCLTEIARLHETQLPATAMQRYAVGDGRGSVFEQYIRYWKRFREVVEAGRWSFPVIIKAMDKLQSMSLESEARPSVVWGDASLRNTLFDGGEITGLVDFEFMHVGCREFDVAFFCYMDCVVAEGFQGVPRLDGFPDMGENFDIYEEVAGVAVANRPAYVLMAGVYNALATTRVYQRLLEEGKVSAEAMAHNPALLYLERYV